MALTTPQLNAVSAYDAAFEYSFGFVYSGTQSVKNRLVVRENASNEVVYDETEDALRLSHIMPAGTLENGMTYNAQVQVFDAAGDSSDLSDMIIFSCHATPEFWIANIEDGEVVTSANLTAYVDFTQAEDDGISEYKYYLYNANKSQLLASDSFYGESEYTYYGLENLTTYYVRAVGKSLYGFTIDTGYMEIEVKYETLNSNMVLWAENQEGKMIIASNIVVSDYEFENDNWNLDDDGLYMWDNSVTYTPAEDMEGDFALIVKARNIPLNSDFIKINCQDGLTIFIRNVVIADRYYCRLKTAAPINAYVLYRPIELVIADTDKDIVITIPDDDAISVADPCLNCFNTPLIYEVRRHNNLYSLIVTAE